MKPRNPIHEERLERLTHQALRQLPPCSAPASLETRVLMEIERRATMPRGAADPGQWPTAARAALATLGALCVPLIWLLVRYLPGALAGSGVVHAVRNVSGTGHTFVSLAELAMQLTHLIPREWLLGGLFVVSAVYAVLLALGYLLLYPSLPHSEAHSV